MSTAAKSLNSKCAGMAGFDTYSQTWAAGYDEHVQGAFGAIIDFVDAVRETASKLQATANAYGAAESASSGAGAEDPAHPYPGAAQICTGIYLASAYGGGTAKYPDWFNTVSDYVARNIWPTGDVDALAAAGGILDGLASDLDVIGQQLTPALDALWGVNTPEKPQVTLTVNTHVENLAQITAQLRKVGQEASHHGARIEWVWNTSTAEFAEFAATLIGGWVIAGVGKIAEGLGLLGKILETGAMTPEIEEGLAACGGRIAAIVRTAGTTTESAFQLFDKLPSSAATTLSRGTYRFMVKGVVSSAIFQGPADIVNLSGAAVAGPSAFGEQVKEDLLAASVGSVVGGAVEELLGGASSFRSLAKTTAAHIADGGEALVSDVLPKAVNAARHRAVVTLSSASDALIAQGVKDWKAGRLVVPEVGRFISGSVAAVVVEKILKPSEKTDWVKIFKDGVTDGLHPDIFPEAVG